MQADYARIYPDLYRRHWWWRAREDLVVATLERERFRRGGAILDVGCGAGVSFDRLGRYGAIEGVEPDAALAAVAGRHRERIHVGPFDRSFAPGRRYALVLMLDVLEHLERPHEALAYALELLEPDGRVLITVPAFPVLWTQHDVINQHHRRYTRASFARLAEAASLRVDRASYHYQWLFPVKLLVRLREALFPHPPRLPGIPREPLNRLLYLATGAERVLLGPLRLPFGSALLVVGGRRAS